MRRLISLLVLLSISFFMYGQRSFSKDPIFDEREPILSCAQPSITDKVLSEDAGTFTFLVNAIPGCRWTLSSNVPWMTVSQAIGLTSATITVTYTSNPDTENRYGILRLNTVNITVTQYGQPAAPDAPSISIVSSTCGEVVLTSTAPFGETYYWQGTSCGTSTSNSSTSYSVTSSGTYYLRARDNSTGLWSTSCGSKTVSVTPDVEAGTIVGGGEYCSDNTSTIILTLENYSGAIANWMRKTPFGDWELINNTKSTYRFDAPILGIFEFKAVVYNVECGSKESPVTTIKMLPPTTGGSISGGTNTCAGNSIGTLTLSGYNGDIKYWQRKLNAGSWTTISNTAGQTTLTQAPTTAGTYYYRAVIENTTCGTTKYSSTKTIVVSSPPVAGTLSGTKTICQGSSTGTMTLSAYSGSISRWERKLNSGSWTSISNTSATYNQTLSTAGTYKYRVLVDNGPCNAVYSNEVTITVRSKPAQPSITASDNVNCAVHSVTLSAPTATAYQWNNGKTTKDIVVNQNDHYAVKVKDAYGCWSNYSPSLEVKLLPLVGVMLQEPLEEGQMPLPVIDLDSQTTGLCEKAYEIRRMPEGGTLYINGELYDDDMNPLLEGYFAPDIYGLGTHNLEYRYTDQTCGMITKNLDVYVESYVNEVSITDDVYRNDASIALAPSHNYDIDNNGTVSFKVDGNLTSNIVPQNLTEGTHTLEQVYTQSGCVDSKQTTFEVKPITYFVNSTSISGSNYNASTHAGQLNDVMPLAIEDANDGNDVVIAFKAPGLVDITAELESFTLQDGSLTFDNKTRSQQGITSSNNAFDGFKFIHCERFYPDREARNITCNPSIVTFKNLYFNALDTAIFADSAEYLNVENCYFEACHTAIVSNNVKNLSIHGCDFQNNVAGIGIDLVLGALEIPTIPQGPTDPDGPLELPKPDTIETITYEDYNFAITNNSFEDLSRGLKISSYFDKRNLSSGSINNNEFMASVEIQNPSKQWIFENNLVENCKFILEQGGATQCSGFELIQTNNHLNETAFNAGNAFEKVDFIFQNASPYNFRNLKIVGYNLNSSTIDIKNDHTSAIIRDVQMNNTDNSTLIEYIDQPADAIIIEQPVVTKNLYVEDGNTFKADEIEFYASFSASSQYGPYVYDFYRADENGKIMEYLGSDQSSGRPNLTGVALLPDDRIALTVTSLNENSIGTSEFGYYHIAPNVIITEIPSELEATNAYHVNYEFFPTNNNWTKGNISMDINEVVWDVEDAYIIDIDTIGQVSEYTRAPSKSNPFEINYYAVGPRTIKVTSNANNWSASSTKSVFISSDNVLLNTDKSYIYKVTPREPVTNINTTEYKDGEDWIIHEDLQQDVQYIDGLGRLNQSIAIASSPGGNDIISIVEYDEYGRESISYLPYTRYNAGQYRKDPVSEITTYYTKGAGYYNAPLKVTDTKKPYAETIFDDSPLNRILEQGAPGSSWQIAKDHTNKSTGQGHTIKQVYETNTDAEVLRWKITSNGFSAIANGSVQHYAPGQLYKIESKNENEALTEEFKDVLGNVVLKRDHLEEDTTVNTYYIYDDFNLLRYVIQPEGIETIIKNMDYEIEETDDVYQQYCFSYKYDSRKRTIEKKIPGAHPNYYVYDKLDRLILAQDGNQYNLTKKINDWKFTKYDIYGNVVMTGIYIADTRRRDELQSYYNSKIADGTYELHEYRSNESGSKKGYAMVTFPNIIGEYEIHTVSYYNDYNFDQYTYEFIHVTGYTGTPDSGLKGKLTAEKVNILGTANWLTTIYFYDEYDRIIQIQKDNYLDGTDVITNEYSFAGELLKTKVEQLVENSDNTNHEITLEKRFEYDFAGRLNNTFLKINAESEFMVSSMSYNELGQLIEKNLHSTDNGTNFLQSIDYAYNIRGWLTHINDADISLSSDNDLFGMELLYQEGFSELNGTAQFNGNISGMKWSGAYLPGLRGYGFDYDNLNRINNAYYAEAGSGWLDNKDAFSVNNIAYDKNGNILQLQRNKYQDAQTQTGILTTQLNYEYAGNRLINLVEETRNLGDNNFAYAGITGNVIYQYDNNGNMYSDDRKNINDITYNHFNLPEELDLSIPNDNRGIKYVYDANGVKLQKEKSRYVSNLYRWNSFYLDNFVYKQFINYNEAGPYLIELDYIMDDEGRIVKDGKNYHYEYFLRDHLGNTRLVFSDQDDDGTIAIGGDNNEVLQETNYYPFGMSFAEQNINYSNKILYNGKELQDDYDLNWLDYGARFLDGPRWTTIDPLAEAYFSISPYAYVKNNPIRLFDPNGMADNEFLENWSREQQAEEARFNADCDLKWGLNSTRFINLFKEGPSASYRSIQQNTFKKADILKFSEIAEVLHYLYKNRSESDGVLSADDLFYISSDKGTRINDSGNSEGRKFLKNNGDISVAFYSDTHNTINLFQDLYFTTPIGQPKKSDDYDKNDTRRSIRNFKMIPGNFKKEYFPRTRNGVSVDYPYNILVKSYYKGRNSGRREAGTMLKIKFKKWEDFEKFTNTVFYGPN